MGGPTPNPNPQANPAPAAPAAEPAPATIVSAAPAAPAAPADPAAPAPAPVAGKWPDDWRANLANGDEKIAKRLERFASPADVWKSYQSLEQKISSGDLKPGLPADATPEQIAEYRKLQGIPETPDGYLKDLPSGVVIGEQDKVLFNDFAKTMHEINASPATVHKALDWYYKFQGNLAAEDAKRDGDFRRTAEDALRSEWGNGYRENVDRAGEILTLAPESIRFQLQGARLPDGTLLGDHPDTLRWLANISRELSPVRTIVPSGGNPAQGLNEELASWDAKIADRSSDYWKGPNAEANQARYRELLDAQARHKARAA